jgi:hypothetical protein
MLSKCVAGRLYLKGPNSSDSGVNILRFSSAPERVLDFFLESEKFCAKIACCIEVFIV